MSGRRSRTRRVKEEAASGAAAADAEVTAQSADAPGSKPEGTAKKTSGKQKRQAAGAELQEETPADVKQARAEVEVTEPDSSGRIPKGEAPRNPAPAAAAGRVFKALSWNVNGLRALLKQHPEKLAALITDEDPDYLCLQEHKLQQNDIEAVQKQVEELLPGYKSYWSAATVKKGYSGTAVIVKAPKNSKVKETAPAQKIISAFFKPKSAAQKPTASKADAVPGEGLDVLDVTFDMAGCPNLHSGEGRLITVEYERFYLVGAYVPNSGMKLERLDYRTQKWDQDLKSYLQELCTRKPAILTGDLNVAHLDIDIHNVAAKHVAKGAGTTPEERSSFGNLLGAGFVDSFRQLHPLAKGRYTYWSVRTSARPVNKGLRLDYFVVPESMCREGGGGAEVPRLHDAWILDQSTVGASDHCPVGIILTGV